MKNLSALVIILLAHCAFAQLSPRKTKKMAGRIHSEINYLASDALEGRLTGSDGEKLSADFIASKFRRYHLKPMGADGSYFQEFQITTLRMSTDKTSFMLAAMNLKQFKDFYPVSISSNQAIFEGMSVDVGFGINNAEPKRNDYEGKDVKGKMVLINLGSPDGVHPHSAYLAWHGIERRVQEAINQGAAAICFYRENDNIEKPDGNLSLKITPVSVPVIFSNRELKSLPPGTPVKLVVDIKTITANGHNVIAYKDNGAATTVVIGAHHDHLGRGEMGNSLSVEQGLIHNGADDNASGVAGLIELSRIFAKKKKWNKQNNYLFIAFSGEELGLLGSKYFTDHPTINLSQVNYMINMDMIGRLDSVKKALVINGVGTASQWMEAIKEVHRDTTKIKEIITTEGGIGASDHTSFYLKQIPSVHFFTGQHGQYHKPSDDVNTINSMGVAYVVSYICELISVLNDDGKLTYKATTNSDSVGRMKFAVTLGIMPDYIYSGEGVRVDGVKDNMPGKAAGLQKDDIIVSLNGVFVKDIKTYMKVLSGLNKGDEVPAQIKRDNQVIDLKIKF